MRSKDVAPRVEKLYKLDERNVDSDKRLLLAYWETYNGLVLTNTQKIAFMSADPAESITRAGRSLRSTGEYTADESVEAQRFVNYKVERDAHGEIVAVAYYE